MVRLKPVLQKRESRALAHAAGLEGTKLMLCCSQESFRDNSFSFLRGSRWIFSICRGEFALEPYVHSIVGGISQIFDTMFERRIPSRFARLRKYLAYFSVLVGKAKMCFR